LFQQLKIYTKKYMTRPKEKTRYVWNNGILFAALRIAVAVGSIT
jgi:hypothetical protein